MTIADGKSAVVDIWIALCDEEELTSGYLLKWLAVLWGPEASGSRGKTCQKLWSKIFFGFSSYNHHGVGSWPAYWSHSRLKAGCDRALYRGHIIFWECSQASILSNTCYIKATSSNPRQYTICYSTNWLSFKPSLITSKSLGDGLLFENTCFFGNCANPAWCTEVNNTELSVEIYLWVCFCLVFFSKNVPWSVLEKSPSTVQLEVIRKIFLVSVSEEVRRHCISTSPTCRDEFHHGHPGKTLLLQSWCFLIQNKCMWSLF